MLSHKLSSYKISDITTILSWLWYVTITEKCSKITKSKNTGCIYQYTPGQEFLNTCGFPEMISSTEHFSWKIPLSYLWEKAKRPYKRPKRGVEQNLKIGMQISKILDPLFLSYGVSARHTDKQTHWQASLQLTNSNSKTSFFYLIHDYLGVMIFVWI